MLADERSTATELLRRAVEHDRVVGQLACALAGVAEQGAEATVDVDHRVALRGPGARRERVELVLDLRRTGAWRAPSTAPLARGTSSTGSTDHPRCGRVPPWPADPRRDSRCAHLVTCSGVEQWFPVGVGPEPGPCRRSSPAVHSRSQILSLRGTTPPFVGELPAVLRDATEFEVFVAAHPIGQLGDRHRLGQAVRVSWAYTAFIASRYSPGSARS